jgi:nitroreductase
MTQTVFDTIRARRSVRKFTADPIPDADLNTIMEAARWAPSGDNNQPWSFGIITDTKQKTALAHAAGDQTWLAEAPVVVACCAHLFVPERSDHFVWEEMAVRWGQDTVELLQTANAGFKATLMQQDAVTMIPGEHIQLAAAALGIGSCWVGFLDTARASQILGLPKDWRCYYLIPIGYPAEEPESERKPLEKITFQNRWKTAWPGAKEGDRGE